MFNKKIISYITSFLASISIIALLIILLPSILIVAVTLILILMIIGLVLRFLIGKGVIKTNFVYVKRDEYRQDKKEDVEKIHEMKDVTNSTKSEKKS